MRQGLSDEPAWTPMRPQSDVNDTLDPDQITQDLSSYTPLRYLASQAFPERAPGQWTNDGFEGPQFYLQVRAAYQGLVNYFNLEPVSLFTEEVTTTVKKQCHSGAWRNGACYRRIALNRICVQVNMTYQGWQLVTNSRGTNAGCILKMAGKVLEPDSEKTYKYYCPPAMGPDGFPEMQPKFPPAINSKGNAICDFRSVNFSIRSSADPVIQARFITKTTLNFGATTDENFKQGLAFLLVGCVVLMPLCIAFGVKNVSDYRARRSRRMDDFLSRPSPPLAPSSYTGSFSGPRSDSRLPASRSSARSSGSQGSSASSGARPPAQYPAPDYFDDDFVIHFAPSPSAAAAEAAARRAGEGAQEPPGWRDASGTFVRDLPT